LTPEVATAAVVRPYQFTSWPIYLHLPEEIRSVSRPELVGGDQTWL